MFETSVVQERVAQRRYGLFSISLAVHSLVVIAVIAAGISSTSLPKDPPHEFPVFFQSAPIPQPPPAPHVASQPAQPHPAAATNVPRMTTAPAPVLTPTTIPDAIPNLPAVSSDIGSPIGTTTGGDDTNIIGDP